MPALRGYQVSRPSQANIIRKACADIILCLQLTAFSAEPPIIAVWWKEVSNSSRNNLESGFPRNRRPAPIPFQLAERVAPAISIPRGAAAKNREPSAEHLVGRAQEYRQ